MNKPIGEKIYELRKNRSLTQEQLGEKLGISGQAVSKWEKGESMPDIMSLPELCEILGVSIDALLEIPVTLKNKNVVKDFYQYAIENSINKVLLETLANLFYISPNSNDHAKENNAVSLSPDSLRIYDAKGMGFIIGNEEVMQKCLETDIEEAAFHLRKLADPDCLSVLRCTSFNNAVTLAEISSITGLDEDAVYKITFALMKRNYIVCDIDQNGKRGYLQGSGMAGVYMILAGCRTLYKDGALNGNLWFSRKNNN